jgi:hypothetical protein
MESGHRLRFPKEPANLAAPGEAARSAHSGRISDARFAMRYPAAGGELADLSRIDRGLRGPRVRALRGPRTGSVETVEIAYRREVGDLACHRDAPLVLAGNLPLDEKGQRLAQSQLALGGFVQ